MPRLPGVGRYDVTAVPANDRDEIFDLVARFDDAVNRRDPDEFSALWAEDAVWEIGDPMRMRAEGRGTIIGAWKDMVAGTVWLFRGSFAGVVTIEGENEARGRWPCVETGTFAGTQSAGSRGYDNRAIYDDLYVRRDGRWLFQHRRYVYLWLSSDTLPGAPVPIRDQPPERPSHPLERA